MKTVKKICGVLFLCLTLIVVSRTHVQAQNYDGHYTLGDSTDQIGIQLGDTNYYPPAYEIISSNTLSDVVAVNFYNSPGSVTIDDGQATNFSSNSYSATFQLAAGQWIMLKIEYGNEEKYVSFYRNW